MKNSSVFGFLSFFLLLITLFEESTSYYFTSVQKTRELVHVETKLIAALGAYIGDTAKTGDSVPNDILKFYQHALAENGKAIGATSFIEHPLNSLKLFKRMNDGWNGIMATMNCDDCLTTTALQNFNKEVLSIEMENNFDLSSLEHDVNGAIVGVVRLRKTYKLDTRNVIQGRIANEQSEPLSVEDVLLIHRILDEGDDFAEAVRWLKGLLEVMNNDGAPTEDISKIARQLASALWKSQHRQTAITVLEDQQKKDPTNIKLKKDIKFYNGISKDAHEHAVSLSEKPSSVHESLCKGEGIRDIKVTSKLKCLYRKTAIPIYVAKEEVLSITPRVSIVYNVTYESEQISIKQFAASRIADSAVLLVDGTSRIDTNIRVSQTAWLQDSDNPIIERICQRVELITGLSTDHTGESAHAEHLQVLNYGFGGMYIPHIDNINASLLPGTKDLRGERLATWMFYLNDVIAGGATVFPKLNVTVPVTKGAAAFWYNTKLNGQKDTRLTHAGCPVLVGSKWVANKWIRESGQIFRRKCGHSYNSIAGLMDSTTKTKVY